MSDQRVISVDDALREQTPRIEFGGEMYEVADFNMEDRLRLANEFKERQEQIEGSTARLQDDETSPEDADEEMDEALKTLQDLMADAVTRVLKDFPEEKARNLTEREFGAIMTAVQKARNSDIDPVEKEVGGKD